MSTTTIPFLHHWYGCLLVAKTFIELNCNPVFSAKYSACSSVFKVRHKDRTSLNLKIYNFKENSFAKMPRTITTIKVFTISISIIYTRLILVKKLKFDQQNAKMNYHKSVICVKKNSQVFI